MDWADKIKQDEAAKKSSRNRLANAARWILKEGLEYRLTDFQQEMFDRAGAVEGDSQFIRSVMAYLEGRGEVDYNFGHPLAAGSDLQEPDMSVLPQFEEHLVPLEAAGTVEASDLTESKSGENTRRALLTQKTIQSHLDEGDTIWVRHPDGTMEEVVFGVAQVLAA